MDWKEIFNPPFMADEYNPGTIWASNFEMVTTPTNLMDIAADRVQGYVRQTAAEVLSEGLYRNVGAERAVCGVETEGSW